MAVHFFLGKKKLVKFPIVSPQSAALFFAVCWSFTNIVVLNLIIALVLEQFQLKDKAKLATQRREVLRAVRRRQVLDPRVSLGLDRVFVQLKVEAKLATWVYEVI